MKILLAAINAKYIHSNLAVYSLRAYAGELAGHITIGEYTINQQVDDILASFYKEQPDVLCISCYIWNIAYVEELVREFHQLLPEVPIWLGGPEVSYETEDFLRKYPQVTGVMAGEGEKTFAQLCDYYVNRYAGETFEEPIPGLIYQQKGSGKFIHTKAQEPLDMSKIPFCYDTLEDFSNRIIYYESSRGCPFRCSYCLSSIDKSLRFRDISLVKQELGFFIEKQVPQVKFVDRTFNCNHTHAMEIWTFIKEKDQGITNFHFEISGDLLNEEELALLNSMRPGLVQLEIGVQSTNEDTIKEIHRIMDLAKLKQIVMGIQSGENIHQHLDLIVGLPEEDYKTFGKSFDEIYSWKPNQLQLGFLKVLKGSYLYEHAKEYGILYKEAPPYEVRKTKWLSYRDVLRIKQVEEMLEVYYNSGQFEMTVKVMEPLFHSAFAMYQELGEFYEEQGYFGMGHSRIRRGEILLEFLKRTGTNQINLFEEAVTFDLYYRENCKSRPAWAPNLAEFKEQTRAYCKKGKLSWVEPFHYHFPGKETKTVKELPKLLEQPEWILFDYEKRDPLDHQAQVTVCQLEDRMENI